MSRLPLSTERDARRRVVVTGLAAIGPLGTWPGPMWDALCAGQSGIAPLDGDWPPSCGQQVAGCVPPDALQLHTRRVRDSQIDRVAALGMQAAAAAMQQAGIGADHASDPAQDGAAPWRSGMGVHVGTGLGGAHALDRGYAHLYRDQRARHDPLSIVRSMANATAGQLAIEWGLDGPNQTWSVACASSAIALGEALRAIRHGYVDRVLAGGAEALLTPGVLTAWHALATLAPPDPHEPRRSCRPFSQRRNGLVLGEGAAFMVLESLDAARARGAQPLLELAGFGARCDARHMTLPHAAGQAAAMRAALDDAGLQPQDIGYLNAHGTATAAGDRSEGEAIEAVFGTHVADLPVSSTKSMHGHLMGAAGAFEAVVAALALTTGRLPPTAGLSDPDPACGTLRHLPHALDADPSRLRAVMSNSFAFGGSNASLVLRRWED